MRYTIGFLGCVTLALTQWALVKTEQCCARAATVTNTAGEKLGRWTARTQKRRNRAEWIAEMTRDTQMRSDRSNKQVSNAPQSVPPTH